MRPRRRAHYLWASWLLVLLALLSWFLPRPDTQKLLHCDGARIAYFIQVSESNVALLNRLLLSLYDPCNYYALHLDLKIDELKAFEALRSAYETVGSRWGESDERNVRNMHIVQSEVVTYRGLTMTMNYLTGANRLLAAGDWDYMINLSGADYPTASQKTIRRLLGQAGRGRNFLEMKPRSTWAGFAEKRLGEFYVDTGLAKVRSATSNFVDLSGREISKHNAEGERVVNPLYGEIDFTVAKSSGWFILSREFCEHLRGDSAARKMLTVFAFSDASDEHYFASVLWNGGMRWRESVVNSNMRRIFFVAPNGSFVMGGDGRRSRQHPFWVDEVGENGEFLFGEELKMKPGFFTRKVRGGRGFRAWMDQLVTNTDYERRLELQFEAVVEDAEARTHRDLWEDIDPGY